MEARGPLSAPLAAAVEALRRGALVVAPTETLLGLLGDALRPAAVRRAARLKRRPAGEPFPVLLPSARAAALLARSFPAPLRRLARRFWPGPLTLLLPARPGLPPALVGPDGTVAVRVPGPSAAALLVRRFGGPLLATSANPRGAPPPANTADLSPALRRSVAVVVPGRARATRPSTIVGWTGRGYRVVRRGAIPVSAIRGAAT
jgi:L-threonylcarbamoyladenylate synthase